MSTEEFYRILEEGAIMACPENFPDEAVSAFNVKAKELGLDKVL